MPMIIAAFLIVVSGFIFNADTYFAGTKDKPMSVFAQPPTVETFFTDTKKPVMVSAYAQSPTVLISTFEITPDAWSPISIQPGTPSRAYVLQARAGKIFYVAESAALGDAGVFLTVKKDRSLSVTQEIDDKGSTVLYLKLIAGGVSEIIEMAQKNTK